MGIVEAEAAGLEGDVLSDVKLLCVVLSVVLRVTRR